MFTSEFLKSLFPQDTIYFLVPKKKMYWIIRETIDNALKIPFWKFYSGIFKQVPKYTDRKINYTSKTPFSRNNHF